MKTLKYILLGTLSLVLFLMLFFRNGIILDSLNLHLENPFSKRIEIPDSYSKVDRNSNGIADPLDVVASARVEVDNRTKYKSNYYNGGFPPTEEGVCTDVVWRGLQGAGIDLKKLMDADIADNIELYPRTNGKPDPNIDFRRVPNQNVFFKRHTVSLTTKLDISDPKNLEEWQPGDIVTFLDGFHHVAIISDKRARDGSPYVIHNTQPFAAEVKLKSFRTPIAGHYRWKF
ncbi:MAG: hypothetical protein K0S51_1877 [Bacillales bacterium]|jgi:uncharacterized protein YijF (DUF1287 family)|nr:hypothetical protein [Bacillales bacterium]